MDRQRLTEIADELRGIAEPARGRFGLYREAHEEDVIARATPDGVVLFAAELLAGVPRMDNPVASHIIPLEEESAFHDPQADLSLHAIELYGDDLPVDGPPRLRITKPEYAAIFGCLLALAATTVCALAGAFWIGRAVWDWAFG